MFRTEKSKSIFVCLVLAFGTALLYAPVAFFSYVNFDDPAYLINNFNVNHGFNWRGLAWCFDSAYDSNWHPLTWMSYMLDSQLFGLRFGWMHVINALLHIASSVLLFLVLRRMTGALWRSAMVAALFAWHPMHVESVVWLSERKDVLSTFFFMLTLWAYARRAKIQNPKSKIQNYWLALVFFALGLMSKPMLVTLPFVLLLLDWWPLKRWTNRQAVATLLKEKIPFFLLTVISCVVTVIAQKRGGSLSNLENVSVPVRLATAVTAYFRYVNQLIYPAGLSPIYPLDYSFRPEEILTAIAFLGIVSAAAVWLWKSRPYFPAGWFWYLGTLVPVIGLVHVGLQGRADRFTYIPSIGLFIAVCWGAYDFAARWPRRQIILGTLGGLVLVGYAMVSAKQIQYWRDGGTLFTHALAISPDNYVAHTSYAAYWRDHHELEKSRVECMTSLRLAQNYVVAWALLGRVLLEEGKVEEAVHELRAHLQRQPESAEGHRMLGQAYLMQKKPEEAAAELGLALQLEPNHPEARSAYGTALFHEGKLEEARAQFAEAVRLEPTYLEARYQLAITLASQQKIPEAEAAYREVLKLQPDSPDALNNMAWILAANPNATFRNGAQAVQFGEKACAVTHYKKAVFIGTLADAYAEAGRFDEAVATAQKAHDVAVAAGDQKIAARNLELMEMYRSHQAFHESAP